MTDTRLHPTFLSSPKIDALEDADFRTYVNGLVYAASQETDGAIPRRSLRLLHPTADLLACAASLVRAGLWEPQADGWRVHDFLDFQTSKAQASAAREAARKRKAKSRASKSSQRDASGPSRREESEVTASDKGQDRDRTGQAREGPDVPWLGVVEPLVCEVCGVPMLRDLAEKESWTCHPSCDPRMNQDVG